VQNPSMSSQEQPEDQSAEDQSEAAEPDAAGPDQAEEPTEDQRLEELGEHIDKARSHAEEAGVIEDLDEEEYADSGATPALDDQTITPPG
jgi:hypothetical protein